MKPKALNENARQAIRTGAQPLFEEIVVSYLRSNPPEDPSQSLDEQIADAVWFIEMLADPPFVAIVHAFYAKCFPEFVLIDGEKVRVLQPDVALEDRASRYHRFNLLFGGLNGWTAHSEKYAALGNDRKKLELMAAKWLTEDADNAELFLLECDRVPGFKEQFEASGAMDPLAGYHQIRNEYEKAGGDPSDLDQLLLASMTGDKGSYDARKITGGRKRAGCAAVALVVVVPWLFWKLFG